MYRSSRLRSTSNTRAITGLDMCKVCTEAVDCVALLTFKTKYAEKAWLERHMWRRHENVSHVCKNGQKSAFTMGTRTCFSRVYMQLGPKTRQAPRTQMYQRKLRQHALFQKHTKPHMMLCNILVISNPISAMTKGSTLLFSKLLSYATLTYSPIDSSS